MIISDDGVAKNQWHLIPDDPDGARIEITVLEPGDDTAINSKVQKLVASDSGGELIIDSALSGHLRAMTALTNWENFYLTREDKAAKHSAPFTAVNKEKALNKIRGLKTFILEKHAAQAQEYEAAQETARKNSLTSANG